MGEVAVGLVIGAFAFASMVLKPWAGWVLDWRGRRTTLIAGEGHDPDSRGTSGV